MQIYAKEWLTMVTSSPDSDFLTFQRQTLDKSPQDVRSYRMPERKKDGDTGAHRTGTVAYAPDMPPVGSLDDGFEIVSHPMTLDYHEHDMPWSDMLERLRGMGYLSHLASTCGL